MRVGARGWILAGCIVVMSQGALGANFSGSLRNYYTEYEVVLQCQEQAQLTARAVELAETAIAKIETYYLQRDTSIDKERLLEQAVANKDEGFRIVARGGKADLRPYCRGSLKELLAKAKEVDPSVAEQ